MRIGTGLIEHQITVRKMRLAVAAASPEGFRPLWPAKSPARRVMHRGAEMKTINDVLPFPQCLITVENTDLANLVFGEKDGCGDHQAVEGAIAAGKVIAGMMEAGTGKRLHRIDFPVLLVQQTARLRWYREATQPRWRVCCRNHC